MVDLESILLKGEGSSPSFDICTACAYCQMFSNKNNNINLTFKNKNIKTLKLLYKSSILKNFLIKNSYTLFFFFEILTKEDLNQIKTLLYSENLKGIQIKKNVLKNFSSLTNFDQNFFNHLIKNNVFLITSNEVTAEFSYKIIQKFQLIKKLHFIGGFVNKTFYRPSELKKLQTLTSLKVSTQVLKTLNFQINSVKKMFLYKKSI